MMTWLSDFRSDVARVTQPGTPPIVAILKTKGLWALLQYRVAHRYRVIPLARPVLFAWRMVIESLTGISIDSRARLGPSCYIGHFGGITIGRAVVIGARCSIAQGVTIGAHRGGSPSIGGGCYVSPGAVVVGGISIGDDVWIGANAVVSQDVPKGAMVRAAPVRVRTGSSA